MPTTAPRCLQKQSAAYTPEELRREPFAPELTAEGVAPFLAAHFRQTGLTCVAV